MKNIQVLDGAVNCEFPIYAAANEEFGEIFPGLDQDLKIVEDFIARVGEDRADAILGAIWDRRRDKSRPSAFTGPSFTNKKISEPTSLHLGARQTGRPTPKPPLRTAANLSIPAIPLPPRGSP